MLWRQEWAGVDVGYVGWEFIISVLVFSTPNIFRKVVLRTMNSFVRFDCPSVMRWLTASMLLRSASHLHAAGAVGGCVVQSLLLKPAITMPTACI